MPANLYNPVFKGYLDDIKHAIGQLQAETNKHGNREPITLSIVRSAARIIALRSSDIIEWLEIDASQPAHPADPKQRCSICHAWEECGHSRCPKCGFAFRAAD